MGSRGRRGEDWLTCSGVHPVTAEVDPVEDQALAMGARMTAVPLSGGH